MKELPTSTPPTVCACSPRPRPRSQSSVCSCRPQSEVPDITTPAASLAVQAAVPGQGYYPGSYEYKYSLPKWHQVMNTEYYNAKATRDDSEKHRYEGNWLRAKIVERTDKNQADSTKKIRERFQDVHYWKVELNRTIDDMMNEIDLLMAEKLRLEKSLRTMEFPAQINLDCTHSRDRRQLPDRVNDYVDQCLYKELILIRTVQDLLRRMIAEANEQLKRNRDAKEYCEFDWGNKFETCNIEALNSKLKNTSPGLVMRHGASIPLPNMSTLEEWCDFSRNGINKAETERAASVRLRTCIEGVLADSSRDLRDHADAVDAALDDRIGELEESLQKLEHHRDRTLDEIAQTEKFIFELQKTLEQIQYPLKVNQTRLDNRKYRSGMESCRDIAHFRLLDEHADLTDSVDSLLRKLKATREVLDQLEQTRLDLEKDISIKHKSLFIDRNRVQFARSKYPSFSKLLGIC